jgi:DNA-binding transcriptional ArsR family regulator
MAKQRELGSVDLETGEILPHVLVAMQQKIPNGFTEGWMAMANSAADIFAGIKSTDDHRVLWQLLARLDFENNIRIEQTAIAEKLAMDKSQVSRAIKRLQEMGIINEGPKVGRSRTYKLNPAYGWKGSSANHQKALRVADKAKAAGLSVVKGGQAQKADGRSA